MVYTIKKDKAHRKCYQSCKLKEVTVLNSVIGLFKFFKKISPGVRKSFGKLVSFLITE